MWPAWSRPLPGGWPWWEIRDGTDSGVIPAFPDNLPGCGPLGGLETALSRTEADWNLVVACDMPEVRAGFLRGLLDEAELSGADCAVPRGSSGLPEPLCAVYHRRCHPAVAEALGRGVRKMTEALKPLRVLWVEAKSERFANVNTPADWSGFADA